MQILKQFAEQLTIDADAINLPTVATGDNSTLESILTGVYMAIGATALFFIIRASLLYVTDGSDPSNNKQARETILYSVVALVGSTMVFALVQFVLVVLE